MHADEPGQAIESRLGVAVSKSTVAAADFETGVAHFAAVHHCDLVVLPKRERRGVARILPGARKQDFSRAIGAPTLFVPEEPGAGFIDAKTGESSFGKVLAPLDPQRRSPIYAGRVEKIVQSIAVGSAIEFLHVEDESGATRRGGRAKPDPRTTVRRGPVIDTIVLHAVESGACMIAMPSAGQKEFLDAVRGSTTERVLGESSCAVLAVPLR